MKAAIAGLFARLSHSRFQRNTLHLLGANVVTQALLLLATPILTRLFSPEDFGITGVFIIWSSFFSAIASWRFEWSVPSAHTEEDSQRLTVLALLLTATLAVFLQIVLAAVNDKTFAIVGLQPIPFAMLLPLFVFGTSVVAVLSSAYVRERTLRYVARSKYVYSGTQLIVSLAVGFAGYDTIGLILAYTLAAAAGAAIMLLNFPFPLAPRLKDISALFATGRRYISEATISSTVSLVNFAFAQCMPLLLLLGYSVHEVGIYFVAMRLAGGPIGLLSGGLSSSFWGEAAALARTDPMKLRGLFINVVTNLTLLFIPIGLACLASPLFLPAVLGGGEWNEVGVVLAACIPQVAGMFIFSSTNHLLVYGRQGYQLLSDLFSIGGSAAMLFVAKAWGLPFTVAIFGISCVVLLAYVLRFALHLKANSEALRAFPPVRAPDGI